MADLEAFKKEAGAWLEENCPPAMRKPMVAAERVWAASEIDFPNDDAKVWYERMVEKRWCVPEWPPEYGGAGLSPEEARVLRKEMKRLGCREPHYGFGLSMVGPVLMEFGSEEQKRKFLPMIAAGSVRWCQGYSEPGAGSDLAGLRTKAEDCGDHYLLNGSKIWTSSADKADWMYCLARTDAEAPKQRGISFLLLDMHQPGIKVDTIRLISGESEFCQVFLDDARADKCDRLGEENEGWTIAKRLLEHERGMMADLTKESGIPLDPVGLAKRHLRVDENGRIEDADLRARIAQALVDKRCMDLTNRRVMDEIAARTPSFAGLMLKYAGTEKQQAMQKLMVEIAGVDGGAWEAPQGEFAAADLRLCRDRLFGYSMTIAGGSSEVQMNIIAKRALGLPEMKAKP